MNKKEITNLVYEMLGKTLAGSSFRLNKADQGFIRRIPGGKQMLGLPIWDYNPEFEFSLNICIRLDTVEEIFHQFSGSPTPKYQAMSHTTATRLDYFGGPARMKVTTAEDVSSAGNTLSSVIRERVIPFFDAHMDAIALDRAVNHKQPGIDITQNPWGAMHAVILAHLAGKTDFDYLVAKHRSAMQLAPDIAHPFNQLVEYLKAH